MVGTLSVCPWIFYVLHPSILETENVISFLIWFIEHNFSLLRKSNLLKFVWRYCQFNILKSVYCIRFGSCVNIVHNLLRLMICFVCEMFYWIRAMIHQSRPVIKGSWIEYADTDKQLRIFINFFVIFFVTKIQCVPQKIAHLFWVDFHPTSSERIGWKICHLT